MDAFANKGLTVLTGTDEIGNLHDFQIWFIFLLSCVH